MLHLHVGDRDPLHARPADHEAGLPSRIAAVEEGRNRLGGGNALERRILSVHRLGPGRHRATGRGLEHVRGEARIRDRQVERPRSSVPVEVHVREVGGREALREPVRHRELGERLVVEPLLVRPRRRHDLALEVVVALGPLLDRVDHP
jgi:hypothetical protein